MTRLPIIMIAVALFSGCAVTPRDVSTGEETASIEGLLNMAGGCWINLTPHRDRPSSRGSRALVVDAGPIEIWARCKNMEMTGDYEYLTPFLFIAEAGHVYKLRRRHQQGPNCLELIDASLGEHVIACEPYFWHYRDLSSGNETAFVRPGKAASDKGSCRHRVGSAWMRGGSLLEVDAGPITIDVTCATGQRKPRWRTLSFDFVAEPRHTYTFTDSDEECIRLFDITSEEIAVKCEPYGIIE